MKNISKTKKILLNYKYTTFLQLKKKTKNTNKKKTIFKIFNHTKKQKSLKNSN